MTKDWGTIGAFLGLDLFKEVLPNIGPDWGVCMMPSKDDKQIPAAIFSLAVKPGSKEKPVDAEIFKSVDFFAKLAVLKDPNAIRFKNMKQGNVEVKYLEMDGYPGFQPACASRKASSCSRPRRPRSPTFVPARPRRTSRRNRCWCAFSAPQLAKLLNQRRDYILDNLTNGQQMTCKEAERNLENVTSLLGLVEHLSLSQQGGDGQASWIIRLTPKK